MQKVIVSLHPKLLVALLVSVALFAPSLGAPPTQQGQDPNNPETSADSSGGTDQQGQENFSLLAALFGKTAVDPKFTLPDVGPPPLAQDAAGLREPTEEPTRSIYRYLVSSSNINFTSDASRLGIALATAEKGDASALERLIAEFETKFTQFQTLVPPPEMQETHEASLKIVLRHIQHLKAARDASPGSVATAWKSEERKAIGEEAGRTVQQIRDIVTKYNIILPSGVLP